MPIKNLNDFIAVLEEAGELIRIDAQVTPELEIAEITDRMVKSSINKALLFTNNGTNFPLLINAMGSEKRICMALRCNTLDDKALEIESLFKSITKPQVGWAGKLKVLSELKEIGSWLPKKKKGRGTCQEVVMTNPELSRLPVLKCWPFDGGPFITLPVVHTVHPDTGLPNAGMYRMQVYDDTTTGMHWHMHKGSAKHYKAYSDKSLRMPVSVTLGGDPVYTYTASAPLPEDVDEYILAGFLRKKKVTLVKCLTNDLYVPEDADFVIEGYVDTHEPLRTEGPFGDHTGFYSLPDMYPVFHVTCITHRKKAVYPATIVGIPPQEDAWLGKATERLFLTPLRLALLPEMRDMNLPVEGVFHNIVLVRIKNEFKGHAFKVMNALWGAGQMMFNKFMIVVNEHVDVNNYAQVLDSVCRCAEPVRDVLTGKGPLDVLDHAANITGFGGKLGIDATNRAYVEPLSNEQQNVILNALIELKNAYPEITGWNQTLIKNGYRLLVMTINKKDSKTINLIRETLIKDSKLSELRYIVFAETIINSEDLPAVVWRAANNTDPMRDVSFCKNSNSSTVLVIDATMKNLINDAFNRDWPNIITSDKTTIDLVDSRWKSYNIGPFLHSPSLKYEVQKYPGTDKVEE